MLVIGNADYVETPNIDDGLDITVTGWILDRAGSAPILTPLGTLSSTVSVDEQPASVGPVPSEVSGTGSFTLVIPIATLQSSTPGMGGLFITVTSDVSGSRSWTMHIRPWQQSEVDAIDTDRFIGGLDAAVKSPTIKDELTGIFYSQDVMVEVDGKMYHKSHGYQPKGLDQE